MSDTISTKKLILCNIAGTLLAGLVLIALQIILFVIVFVLSTSGIITTSQAYKTLSCLHFTSTTPTNTTPVKTSQPASPASPTQPPIQYDYYTVKPTPKP